MQKGAISNLFTIASIYNLKKLLREALNQTIIVAIGQTTQKTINNYEIKVDIIPKRYTVEEMIVSVDKYVNYHALKDVASYECTIASTTDWPVYRRKPFHWFLKDSSIT
ncbi:MAG: uroporphyrinogen-III synthase, partial [Candidatus Lokiarchaeota archaeon]|nr:uroporphyrinogen-III synthase [Candidatus Lokiarchaeota archaeon]